jgi:S-adenosylmethionine uptake transporter
MLTPNKNYAALYGIAFMLLNTISLAIVDIASKVLRTSLSAPHIVFFYKFGLLLAILPWVLKDGWRGLKTERIHVHIIRSSLSVLGVMCFVHGLNYVQMADAAALENIQYIMLVLIGMIFFREEITMTKIAAILIGFVGALIVVRPDLLESGNLLLQEKTRDSFYGYTLIAIGCWTMNTVSVKLLGRTEKNKTQMFYLMLFACMWAAPVALVKWEHYATVYLPLWGNVNLNLIPASFYRWEEFGLELWHVKYLVLAAVAYFIHGVAYFKALKHDLSIVVPFRYTKLLFSGLLGMFIFNEIPSRQSYYGYALIILSGLMLLRSEYKKAKAKKKKPVEEVSIDEGRVVLGTN